VKKQHCTSKTKVNTRFVKYLCVKPTAVKLLEGKRLFDFDLGNDNFGSDTINKGTKAKTDKSFCTAKEIASQGDHPQNGRIYLQNTHLVSA
jgi:hypothetical protein